MATFSDFYRQQASAIPQSPQTPAGPKKYDFSWMPAPGQTANDPAPQSPLNWLLDIITRPSAAINAGVSGIIEGVAGAQEAAQKGDALGAAGSFLGGLVAAPTNTLAGLTSTDRNADFKKGWSHSIERFTDRFGKLNDPNYIDRENNVNEVVKGTLGFVGDVALDPLTWIPGGLILNGLKGGAGLAAKGVNAAASAGKKALGAGKAADEAVEVAETAAKVADDVPAPAPKVADEADNAFGGGFQHTETPSVTPATKTTKPTPQAQADLAVGLREALNNAPKTPIVRQEIKDIFESVSKGSTKMPDGAAPGSIHPSAAGGMTDAAPQQSLPDWVQGNMNRPVTADEVDVVLESMTKAPAKAIDELNTKLSEKLAGAEANAVSTVGHLHQVIAEAPKGSALQKTAMGMMKRLHQLDSVKSARTEVTDALAAFSIRREADTTKLRDTLGEPLFNELSKKNTPASMDASMKKILDVLDPEKNVDLARFYSKNPSLGNALNDSLEIPRYVKPAPNTVEEVAETLARAEADPIIVKSLVKLMRKELPISAAFFKKYPDIQGKVAFTQADTVLRDGNRYRELNTMFQQSLFKDLWNEVSRVAGDVKGNAGAVAKKAAVEDVGSRLVNTLQTMGVKLHIGIGEDLVPITFPEVFELVGKAMPKGELRALYHGGSAVAVTPLLQAVHRAITVGDGVADDVLRANIREIITDPKKHGVKGSAGELLPNNITRKSKMNPNPGKLVDELVDGIMAARPALISRVAANVDAFAARGVSEAAVLGQAELNALKELVGRGSYAEVMDRINSIGKNVAANATDTGALQSATIAAREVVEKAVGDTAVKVAKAGSRTEQAVAQGVSISKAVEKGSEQTFKAVKEAAEEFDEVILPGGGGVADDIAAKTADDAPIVDLSQPDPVIAQQGFVNQIWNGARGLFDQTYGVEKLWPVMYSKMSVGGHVLKNASIPARELRKFDLDVQKAAVQAVKSGVPNSSPEVSAAAEHVDRMLSMLFDTKGTGSLLDNKFLGVENNLDHINAVIRRHFDEGTNFQFKTFDTLEETLDQWKNWDFANPSVDLYKLTMAATKVTEHRAMVESFVHMGRAEGLIHSSFKPGTVKLGASGKSTFASLMPEGIYVDKALANELGRLDVLTNTSRQLSGEVGEMLRKTILPAQSIWKQLVTVFRVGHHTRNFLGNSFMSWVDRGNKFYASSQRDALRLMGMRNNYSDVDIINVLKSTGDDLPILSGNDKLFSTQRFGDVSAQRFMDALQRRGVFTTFAASEDLMGEVGLGAISRVGEKITNSRVGNAAGSVSQFVDHQGKVQHAIQIFRQEASNSRYTRWGKNLSFEKLMDRTVREVRRAHPDSMMLTPFESKYRVLIPFYTWFAKTLPFAMESMARNPGRIAALPKASYNLAVATGVNPDSLIDPFPEDQLFPSYITEGVFGPQFTGPDGEYININPGVPQFDMLREVTQPQNMLTPFLKVPAELATGSRFGGAPITDTSDYLDQNLPIISYIANMTGISPTGTILNGQLDQQSQVAKGNKGPLDQGLTFANWFSGLNAQNWSRPNIVNYAEIEKRNRESGKGSGF